MQEDQTNEELQAEPTEFKSSYNGIHRWAAISFIVLLLTGNVWLGYYVATGQPPEWIQLAFYLSILSAVGAGVALGLQKLMARLS